MSNSRTWAQWSSKTRKKNWYHYQQHLKRAINARQRDRKTNMMLGKNSRNFDYKSPKLTQRIYSAFVSPHLEAADQFWPPDCIKGQHLFEGRQRRASKQIPLFRDLPYDERLKRSDLLLSLQKRRVRRDSFVVFKIVNRFGKKRTQTVYFRQLITQ